VKRTNRIRSERENDNSSESSCSSFHIRFLCNVMLRPFASFFLALSSSALIAVCWFDYIHFESNLLFRLSTSTSLPQTLLPSAILTSTQSLSLSFSFSLPSPSSIQFLALPVSWILCLLHRFCIFSNNLKSVVFFINALPSRPHSSLLFYRPHTSHEHPFHSFTHVFSTRFRMQNDFFHLQTSFEQVPTLQFT
jgi:hypothetical protein